MESASEVKEISPAQVKAMVQSKTDFQIIDVREDSERMEFNLDGISIPFDEVMSRAVAIAQDMPVVFYC